LRRPLESALRAVIGVVHYPTLAPGPRIPIAILSASSTMSVRMCTASCQPTIIRENTSITNARYRRCSQQRSCVGTGHPEAVGDLSGEPALDAVYAPLGLGIGLVVRGGRPRRLAPRIAAERIRRATRSRPTSTPWRLELLPDAPLAVALVVGPIDLPDQPEQALVLEIALQSAR